MLSSTDRKNAASRQARILALMASTALIALGVSNPARAQSLPTGGTVAAGRATIGPATNGAVIIAQSSANAVINWQSYNIGAGNNVTYVQPDAASAVLNRVTGTTTTTIAGQLNANGQVYIVNPNGIAITATGTINTAGFVASTLDISDSDFMSGKRGFTGNGASASVSNAGRVTIARGGYLALIGGTASNSGTITVPMGKVALGSGEQATLDLSGDGFLQVAIPTSAGGTSALVSNNGMISANGGLAQLSAAAARDIARQAVNMSGTIEAKGVAGTSGSITLSGGNAQVIVSGALDASNAGGNGGLITVTGADIALTRASLSASGATGGGTIRIGGDRRGSGTLAHAATLSVDAASTIKADATQTGAGGSVVLWSDSQTAFAGTISARGGALGGDGGSAEVSSKGVLSYTGFTDLTAAKGTTGALLLDPYDLTISTDADSNSSGFTASGTGSVINVSTLTTALTGANVTVSTGSSGSDAGNITVAAPVSWNAATTLTLSAANNIALDAAVTAPTGGLTLSAGGTISDSAAMSVGGVFNLTSGAWVQNAASLPAFSAYDFQITGGSFLRVTGGSGTSGSPYTVADVYGLQGIGSSSAFLADSWALAGDIDASGTVNWNSGAGFNPIGGNGAAEFNGTLDGQNHIISGLTIDRPSTSSVGLIGYTETGSTLENIGLVGGSFTGKSYVGSLAGWNEYGTITNVYATGAVSGSGNVGGLIGYTYGSTITNAYATGAVTGGSYVGGLVGQKDGGAITNAYATGAVTSVTAASAELGGLVGYNYGTITNAYATGAVTEAVGTGSAAGGLVGYNGGTITASFWDTGTSGQASGVGGGSSAGTSGLTTAQARTQAAYTGWDFTNTWYQTGDMRPILRSEAATPDVSGVIAINNLHQLALIGANLSDNYRLTADIDASETENTASTSSGSGVFNPVTGWVPLGAYATPFTGTLDGQNHIVTNLTINRPSSTGLFLSTGASATIENIGLVGVSITGAGDAATLAGYNAGTVTNVYATGTLTSSSEAGGLVGYNASTGTISNAYTTVAVTSSGFDIGGLTGQNYGTISNAYATGAVSGEGEVGGLVGFNGGTISYAYATGASSGNSDTGGLVGWNTNTIDDSYASGAVSKIGDFSSADIGGFTGINSGTITASFWDMDSSGQVSGTALNGVGVAIPGVIGLTTAQARSATAINAAFTVANMTTWDFTNTWYQTDDMRPILRSEAAAPDSSGVVAIHNLHQLALIGANLAAIYKLTADIDASETENTTSTASGSGVFNPVTGWVPLGSSTTQFTGTFDGQNHIITNLTINRPSTFDEMGLFGSAGVSATLENIGLVGASVAGNSQTGLLVGENDGAVSNAYAIGTVSGSYNVGGLTGENFGTISNAYATGAVTSTSNVYNGAGGLVGYNGGTISNAYSSDTVSGSGSSDSVVGGLVGTNGGTITSAYATGKVTGSGNDAGGLVGENDGAISNAYAIGAVAGSNSIGGLVGLNGGSGTITSAYATGKVTGSDDTGGLAGENDGAITNAYATSVVSASGGDAGGLVGLNVTGGTISNAYATGAVTGENVGGLVGESGGAISNAYATGAVTDTGGTFNEAGGLVGGNSGSISNTYATGVVTGGGGTYGVAGGLVGANSGEYGTITASFWDTETTGQTSGVGGGSSAGATGLTTAQMNDPFTFIDAGWDFAGVWATPKAGGAPVLRMLAADPVYGYYVRVSGDTTTTYGSMPSTSGITVSGLGAGNVSVAFGSAITTSTNAGTYAYSAPNVLALSYAAGSASDYYVGYNGSLSINPATVTLTPVTLTGSKVYDGTTSFAAIDFGTGGTIAGVNGETLTLSGTGSVASANVGTYALTLGSLTLGNGTGLASNYQIASSGNTGTITARPITVTANSGQSMVYGDMVPALTYTVGGSGMVNGDSLSGALATSATSASNAGSYGITQGTLENSNYTITAYTGADLAVTARPITVTYTADAASSTYGDAITGLTGSTALTSGNLVNGDTLGGTASFTATASGTSNVGSYAINGSGLTASSNYLLTSAQAAGNATALSITARPITVTYTAGAASSTYGDAIGALTGTTTVGGAGLVNGDTLSGTASFITTANGSSNVGTYGIIGSGLTLSSNYSLTSLQAAGNATALSITVRPILVTADSGQSMVYGDAAPGLTYAVGGSGLVNGDSLSGALATSASSTSNVGSYAITQGTLAASTNYTITYTGANLAVTPRPITLTYTADAASSIYGDTPTGLGGASAITSGNLVNGDTLSGTASFTTPAGGTSNVGSYAITGSGLTLSSNYSLTSLQAAGNATALSITARPITVTYTANGASNVYGDTLAGLTGSYTLTSGNLVNGDILSGTASFSTTASGTSSVGSYAVDGSGLIASTNYLLTSLQAAGNASALGITARPITVTADTLSKFYGAANPALTYAVSGAGLVNNDTLSGALATDATTTSAPGAYAVTQGTLAASPNYALTFVPGRLTVLAAQGLMPAGTDGGQLVPSSFAPRIFLLPFQHASKGDGGVPNDARFDGAIVCATAGDPASCIASSAHP